MQLQACGIVGVICLPVRTALLVSVLPSNVALVLMHRINLCDDVSMAIIDP